MRANGCFKEKGDRALKSDRFFFRPFSFDRALSFALTNFLVRAFFFLISDQFGWRPFFTIPQGNIFLLYGVFDQNRPGDQVRERFFRSRT
jgi:hypothetical protein